MVLLCELHVDSDADPPFVVDHIVDAVRNGFAQLFVFEVMNANMLRLALGLPFLAAIVKIADELLLCRVHGDRRLPPFLKPLYLLVQVLKLCVAVRVLPALARFSRRLKAVADLPQQRSHGTRRGSQDVDRRRTVVRVVAHQR